MPPPLFHSLVAQHYCIEYSRYHNSPDFYLGNIAPDAVYTRSDYSQEMKQISHLQFQSKNHIDSVLGYFRKSCKSAYLWGYCFHILTDIMAADMFKGLFDSRETPHAYRDSIYHKEIDLFTQNLYQDKKFCNDIFSILAQAVPYSVDDLVTSDEVAKEIEYVMCSKPTGESSVSTSYFSIPQISSIARNIAKSIILIDVLSN